VAIPPANGLEVAWDFLAWLDPLPRKHGWQPRRSSGAGIKDENEFLTERAAKMLGHRKLYDEENPTYREALAAAEAARRLPLPAGVNADIYLYDVAQVAIGEPDPKEIDWAFVAAKQAYGEMKRSHAFQVALRNRKDPKATPAVLLSTKYSGANNWPAGCGPPVQMAAGNENDPPNEPEVESPKGMSPSERENDYGIRGVRQEKSR